MLEMTTPSEPMSTRSQLPAVPALPSQPWRGAARPRAAQGTGASGLGSSTDLCCVRVQALRPTAPSFLLRTLRSCLGLSTDPNPFWLLHVASGAWSPFVLILHLSPAHNPLTNSPSELSLPMQHGDKIRPAPVVTPGGHGPGQG